MGRRSRDDEGLLTPAELEVMNVLWERGGSTVNEVQDALSPADGGDGRAYTTVATILRILETKGFASSAKDGRRLVYAAVTARDDYESNAVKDLLGRLFAGRPGDLVRRLLGDGKASEKDLEEIRRAIDAADQRSAAVNAADQRSAAVNAPDQRSAEKKP
jgi:predicted transcriptional regulator